MSEAEAIAEQIRIFAQEHNLRIHPRQDAERWAELVIEKGGCPCVPGRDECPCEFIGQDIAELNRCRCGLFVNDAYIEEYHNLLHKGKSSGKQWKMEDKARGEFLKKLAINGFSIEDKGDTLTLSPRGAEGTTSIIIQEVEPNRWQVIMASGNYAGFLRGKKRDYFEGYINRWVEESILRVRG